MSDSYFHKVAVTGGVGLGSAMAVTISWSVNHSIWWALCHGVFSWFYIIYFHFWVR